MPVLSVLERLWYYLSSTQLSLWHPLVGSFDGWERIYEALLEDQELKRLLERLELARQKCTAIRDSIFDLKGFKMDY